jgi:putative ABC transport system permease protein
MAWRHLLRHKTFSLINILGLSTGIAACLVIYGYVHYQESFDSYHPKADRIARVTTIFRTPESEMNFATTLSRLGPSLKRDCPEVEETVRIEPSSTTITHGGSLFSEDHFVYTEQSIFSIFQFAFLEGSPGTALAAPNSIVLTQSIARKYFHQDKALGKTLVCDRKTYQVTAVIADRPSNSDLRMDALMWKDYLPSAKWMDDDFESYTYVLFRGAPDLPRLQRQMDTLSVKEVQPELNRLDAGGDRIIFRPEMLSDVHFSKGKLIDTPKGSRLFDTIFSVLAVFILVVALLNYVNLSTARAAERAKEVAIRKVAGAKPLQLMTQFMGESFFLMTIAWLVGFVLAEISIPYFNRLLSTDISLQGWHSLLLFAWVLPLTAVIAGAWPAFVLSGFQPIRVLKGLAVQTQGIGLRKTLIIAQFIIALAMLTGTVVIHRQMQYIRRQDLGADRRQMLALNIPRDDNSRQRQGAFTQAVRQTVGVQGVSLGSGIPIEGVAVGTTSVYTSSGKKKEMMCNFFYIDPQFIPLLHIQMAEGRNFSESFHTDKKEAHLVNQAFVRAMGWRSGVGQVVGGLNQKGKIVGVVKDFFYKSLHNVIEPAIFSYADTPASVVLVKAQPSVLPRLRTLWNEYFPNDIFNYYFLDESFESQYKDDRTMMTLFNGFTLLAIFISCLGLYGLVSLITVRRMREIGIRKVLGASGRGLVLLLTREFFLLMGFAALVALPLAGWGLYKWLSSYAYHTSLTVDMFGLPLVLLAIITLSVTGLRVIRAVLRNPVESLRTD